MIIRSTLLTIMTASLLAQGGLDILNQPQNALSAGLGLNLDPLRQPHLLAAEKRLPQATLGTWSRADQVSGADVNLEGTSMAAGLRVISVTDIEVRENRPTLDPISTFDYSLITANAAYGHQFGALQAGVGFQVLRERSLGASALGFALHVSAEYPLLSGWTTAAGIRNLGIMGKLENEASEIPAEAWLRIARQVGKLHLQSELNSGPVPLHLGTDFELARTIHLLGGLQLETAEELALRPSAGLVVSLQQFRLGFALSDLAHPLGMRQHYTLFWNF